jgi:putative heme-binding domain-containing protein
MTALSLTPTLELSDQQIADLLSPVLEQGEYKEQQVVLETLGDMNASAANKVLSKELDKLLEGNYPNELQLDLMQAAKESNSESLAAKLDQYESSKPSDDVVAANQELLHGGDVENGRNLLFGHDAAQCMRCHAVGGNGASVGPDLANIGTTLNREQLLESLIAPNERIAPGYGTVSVTLEDGENVTGVVQEETDAQLVIQSADGTTRKISKNDIAEQDSAPSSMPPMGTILEKSELRDMIEFLSTLKGGEQ